MRPIRPHRSVIVVAVDGRPESAQALRWAARQAETTGAGLRVVSAFDQPAVGSDAAGAYWRSYLSARESTQERVGDVIDTVLGDGARLRPDVDHVVAPGVIDHVLADHTHDASMVVVGTRCTRRWSARLRPSLTNRLTGKLDCPVVSVAPSSGDQAAAA